MTKNLVLVTGGAGFIGSNIIAELGADHNSFAGPLDIVVCDRLRDTHSGKWRNLAKHDIKDLFLPDQLDAWLAACQDRLLAVIHMGAISSTTQTDADLILQTNFTLSKILWDLAVKIDCPLIYASSAATYGDGDLGFEDCEDYEALKRLRPLNAYGWSKALFDLYAKKQALRGKAPRFWAGLKFFNVYGPNEYHKGSQRSVIAKIWPDIVSGRLVKLFRSEHPLYPDGGQLRDFVSVFDAAKIVVWLLEQGLRPTPPASAISGIYNIGSGKAGSFRDLALAGFAAIGRLPDIEYIDMPEPLKAQYQYYTEASMAKLRAAGYDKPLWSLSQGISHYVQNYLSQKDIYR